MKMTVRWRERRRLGKAVPVQDMLSAESSVTLRLHNRLRMMGMVR